MMKRLYDLNLTTIVVELAGALISKGQTILCNGHRSIQATCQTHSSPYNFTRHCPYLPTHVDRLLSGGRFSEERQESIRLLSVRSIQPEAILAENSDEE